MIFVVDIGNTNITVAQFSGRDYLREWRLNTDIQQSAADYEAALAYILKKENITPRPSYRVVLSSVVPILTPVFQKLLTTLFGQKPILLAPHIYQKLPITIPASCAAEIGTDLVANAVAAWERYHSAAIVVDFGTALSFTIINSRGEIAGVDIAPGLRTAVNSLFANTAQLPQVQLALPADSLGQNTEHSIQAGIILGYRGLINGLVTQIKNDLHCKYGEDGQKIKVVATGGLSSILAPTMEIFDNIDYQLTLRGLALIAGF